jgi:2-polyprenyl-6-methoxyphenol hydroxylase-like FAD-dependent oxidoreductase
MTDEPRPAPRTGRAEGHPRAAAVVGGGIAGLATAIALAKADWDVTVLEQAAVFWEAGAGLTITPNGERALAAIGVADAVRAAGHRVTPTGIRASDGRWLCQLSPRLAPFEAIGIHRRSLHGVLVDAANLVTDLRPGSRVLGLGIGATSGRQARVRWLEGSREHVMSADLLIGADGVNSVVRPAVAPAADVRHSGFTAWRAVVADDQLLGRDLTIWWGAGVEFSVQRIGPDRVSWHCLLPHEGRASLADGLTSVSELLAGWPEDVRDVISLTQPGSIFRHDISVVHGNIRSFSAGRTVLVGDAAHPLLPTTSQGANLGLEDGLTLGALLGSGADLARGLQRFDQVRLPRARRTAKTARMMARIGAGCPAGLGQVLRDAMLELLPTRRIDRFCQEITDWQAPDESPS